MVRVIDYIKSSHSEVKKVTWPSREDVIRLTSYVIGVSVAVGLFVTIFDYVFKELLTILLIK